MGRKDERATAVMLIMSPFGWPSASSLSSVIDRFEYGIRSSVERHYPYSVI